ncbi:MAG: MarR family winged helix-turn-helix transcriptional regulator [Phyllobacterium sp.]
MTKTEGFDLESFLPYRLNRAAEFVGQRFASRYRAEYGLTRPEWRTLAALGSVGRMTATEVGIHSSMHKTKVSRAVYSLEQRRWLRRIPNEKDRRIEYLELTSHGRHAYQEIAGLARTYQSELLSLLGRQALEALSLGLDGVEAAMIPDKAATGPGCS